ncbi:class A beta-lactamase [Rhizosaccharibacter radicis]|uniref:beta-lactamase n=1 Tax=Rhizosaccharibacter radicis TaxID=2782605 RepID=A0ABT1VY52_9PROT|nr:class A beta-lactamase [Acetobacteraceae bacterium KSS12]
MKRRDVILGGGLMLSAACARRGAIAATADDMAPLRAFERASGGHVGMFAQNLRTGAALSWREADRFVACSTFKVSVAALALRAVERGEARPGDRLPLRPSDVPDWHAPAARAALSRGWMTLDEMSEAAVTVSDNSCANILLWRFGGPAAVTALWRQLGDREGRLDDGEPMVNRTPAGGIRDTVTPRGMARVLQGLLLGDTLAPASRDRLIRWMVACETGLDRLRAGLPARWRVGDKTGNNGADAAGDIAMAWADPSTPIVICAYTRGGIPTQGQFKELFPAIGRLVAARLGPLA